MAVAGAFAIQIWYRVGTTDYEFIEMRFKEFNQGSSSILLLLLLFSSICQRCLQFPFHVNGEH